MKRFGIQFSASYRKTYVPLTTLSLIALFSNTASANGLAAALNLVPTYQPGALIKQPPTPTSGPVIGEIVVQGNKVLSTAAIISLSGHKVGDPCNEQTLAEMRDRLLRTGNFGQHVADQNQAIKIQAEQGADNKCKVIITVDENDKIEKILISGSGPIPPEEVNKLIEPLRPNVYNEENIRNIANAIQDLYNKRGFLIEFGQIRPDAENPGYLPIPIIVTRVDDIKINGKRLKTREFVLLREMKTKKGDYYNRKNFFEKDLLKLYNLDLFEDLNPVEEIVGVGRVRLIINLVEKRTGTISAGIGFSNRQQLLGRAELSETNFRGRGEAVNLLWETGGVSGRNSVELGYTRPWVDKHQTALSFNIFDKVVYRFANSLQNTNGSTGGIIGTDDSRYNEQRTGLSLSLSRPFQDTFRGSINIRAENVRTNRIDLDELNTAIIQNGPIYTFGAGVQHDTRDLLIDPISGGYQNANFQVGYANLRQLRDTNGNLIVQPVTGNVNFGKGFVDLRTYISLSGRRKKPTDEKTSLAFRLMLGSSVGTLPFFEQFFVGGAESLRGYREDRFWGRHMFIGSAEFRVPLAKRLKGVFFLDVGHAWGGRYSDVTIEGFRQSGLSPRLGIGLGIRVGTPLGPIRLDYGFGSEGGRTHFSIGNVF